MNEAMTDTAPIAGPIDIKLAVEPCPGGGYILHVDGKMHCARTSPEEVQDVIGDLVADRFGLSQPVPGSRLPQDMPGFMQRRGPEAPSFEQQRAEAFEAVEEARKAHRMPASVNLLLALLAGVMSSVVGA